MLSHQPGETDATVDAVAWELFFPLRYSQGGIGLASFHNPSFSSLAVSSPLARVRETFHNLRPSYTRRGKKALGGEKKLAINRLQAQRKRVFLTACPDEHLRIDTFENID